VNTTTFAISSTFTAEPLGLPLRQWLADFRLPHQVAFAPYGQVLQSLLDPRSHLSQDKGGLNLVLVRLEDLASNSSDQLEQHATELVSAVQTFCAKSASQTILCLCPSDSGDHSQSTVSAPKFDQIEQSVLDRLAHTPGVSAIASGDMQSMYPVPLCFDKVANRTGHIPYTREFYVSLASTIVRRLRAIQRKPTKFLALDCDNTLWQGVCGEQGWQGIQISAAHQAFQRQLLECRKRGILLTLASKNNEQDVWDVFEKNPHMILRREHVAAAAINWNTKSSSVRWLADRLRLGVNSCVFLDDNPVEIAEVRANCCEAISIQVPGAERLTGFLDHIWPLDQLTVTQEDRKRAESYAVEAKRADYRDEFVSLREFLSSLNLRTEFVTVSAGNAERAAQLTQRTNQFNCSLRREIESELLTALAEPSRFAYLVDVADKFGDYGFVGLMQGQRRDAVLYVDAFMLSCRALRRGVERAMMRHLGQIALEQQCSTVAVNFVAGPRNTPAADFLKSISTGIPQGSSGQLRFDFDAAAICAFDPLDVSGSAIDTTQSTTSDVQHDEIGNHSQTYDRIANECRTTTQVMDRLTQNAGPRSLDQPLVEPRGSIEQRIASICSDVLHIQEVGATDALKDLGATSIHIVQIHSLLAREFGQEIPITDLYTLPSIRSIAERVSNESSVANASPASNSNGTTVSVVPTPRSRNTSSTSASGVAIIGMAGRFPGSDNVAELWENLLNGVNCITEISDADLNLSEDSPLRTHPNLVRKSAAVKDADKFDAKFFGIFPKEAQVMDPQHRLMLECCWHAMEDAGYQPDGVEASVGVFAGCYMDTYILASLTSNPKLLASLANSFHGGDLHTELGNDKDYLATRISFLLNLRGPAITVQTACSTSLVAIIQACQSIQLGQCEMALAGGSTLKLPQNRGYLYAEGGMVSPDGICRPFDADARGTVFGEGVGAVLLKNLDAAIADGDEIYGVIRGWGINNDGRSKMGYTAPSVEGQSSAVLTAHQHAGFSADSITYMEAHGTGTSLGDPIEIDALSRAFRASTDKNQFCAIGSVKSNIGHLDVAAGVTGLMKCCLAMKHGVIPPSINFKRPNPNIDFEKSPFYVASEKHAWNPDGLRRAGVSSFGVGGTNAHIVIEEGPARELSTSAEPESLLVLSAKNAGSLEAATSDLAKHLDTHSDLNLADVAFTLQEGRKHHNYSRVVVADSLTEAKELLASPDQTGNYKHHQVRRDVPVAMMFPGQGSQHLNMGLDLHKSDPVFRAAFDECCELLRPHLEFDLRDKIFVEDNEINAEALKQTTIAQPAIFSLSYSLAMRLKHIGIEPQIMIGHSVGEFVAACVAGVFTLQDALNVVAFRGKSMQALPPGNMMAVRLSEKEVSKYLQDGVVELAAINGPSLCVVAGQTDRIAEVRQRMEGDDVVCRPLITSHAFHSQMMEPAIEPIAELVGSLELHPPQIPIISSVTGRLLTDAEATDPRYWARHLRETVRFTTSIETLHTEHECTLLEVGAGQTLSTLSRQHPAFTKGTVVLSSMPHPKQGTSSARHFLTTVGRLWQAGVPVNWANLRHGQVRRRVHLPAYPFERIRHWFSEEVASPSVDYDIGSSSEPDVISPSVELQEVEGTASNSETPPTDEMQQLIQRQIQLMRLQLDAWNS